MPRSIVGLDIGGANLKAAHRDGHARVRSFALWKQPDRLSAELVELLGELPPRDELAVTMTGELCDCFANRREGVQRILDAVERVAAGRPLRIWTVAEPDALARAKPEPTLTGGGFLSLRDARRVPFLVASANWLALAAFAARLVPNGPGLLVDMGSTTTDLTPLAEGAPRPRGRTDHERLLTGELLYQGAARTPFFALLPSMRVQGRDVQVIPEFFATVADAYTLLGETPEDPADVNTPDGRPATREFAAARIARHLGADADMLTPGFILQASRKLREAQLTTLATAIHAFALSPQATIILAGSGEFLLRAALERLAWKGRTISLKAKLGAELSTAACAYAVAILTAEECA